MKKTITIVVIVFFTITINAQNWMHSLEDAKKTALASNKLILVDFWASWCGPCRKMDLNTWSRKEVTDLMQNFVPLKIDIDSHRSIAKHYGVRGIPNVFIIDANGKVIYSGVGYRNKSQMAKTLTDYMAEMSFLQKELIAFYKKSNYSTALRLADKYQIYSIYAKGDIKRSFLNLAKEYFEISKKDIKKKKLKNAKTLNQKIKLFNIRKQLVLKRSKKVLKQITKIKETEILQANVSLYSFLNYVAYKQMGDNEKALKWVKKLNPKDKKIAELILKV